MEAMRFSFSWNSAQVSQSLDQPRDCPGASDDQICAIGGGIIDLLNKRLRDRLREIEILNIFTDVCEVSPPLLTPS